MAGMGPRPKDPAKRARSNADPIPAIVLKPKYALQPDLPEGFPWPARTVEWWEMWRDSPQAPIFTSTDWDFLLDTALIHADVWGNWNLDRLAELRLRVAKFGATPEDRARLRISFAQATDAELTTASKQLTTRERFGSIRIESMDPDVAS